MIIDFPAGETTFGASLTDGMGKEEEWCSLTPSKHCVRYSNEKSQLKTQIWSDGGECLTVCRSDSEWLVGGVGACWVGWVVKYYHKVVTDSLGVFKFAFLH